MNNLCTALPRVCQVIYWPTRQNGARRIGGTRYRCIKATTSRRMQHSSTSPLHARLYWLEEGFQKQSKNEHRASSDEAFLRTRDHLQNGGTTNNKEEHPENHRANREVALCLLG